MKQRFLLLALIIGMLSPSGAKVQLIINEIMQGNIDCLVVDKEYPDSSVELYNPTDEDINIQCYGLSLTKRNPFVFNLSQNVKPKGCLIICCDKEGKKLHTDFRLDAGSRRYTCLSPGKNRGRA